METLLFVRVPEGRRGRRRGETGEPEASQGPGEERHARRLQGVRRLHPQGPTQAGDLRRRERAGARKSRESAPIGPLLGACASVRPAIGGGKVSG